MDSAARDRVTLWAAMAACGVMIAHHVGAKAVRDALFLSSFEVTSLPKMVMAAAGFSILSVLAASKAMARFSPARLVPASFAASAILLLAIWSVLAEFPRASAILVYLQIVGLGSLLTSGFWSVMNERFDPRTAKQLIGRIAGAGTLGGIGGGLLAERVAAKFSMPVMLPILAAFHLACAVLVWVIGSGVYWRERTAQLRPPGSPESGWKILKRAPYLRTLAALVLLGTVSAAMVDYVFKAQAVSYYGRGDNLLRFFAVFYAAVGVLSFFVQTGLSGISLTRLGLPKTVGTLPLAVSAGSLGALLLQGLITATLARALEAIFRGSLFRAGYELFYTPMPTREKRAAKPIVDVGFDRMGDALGSGLVSLMLGLGAAVANQAILTGAILVALAGLWMASRLQGAYIGALERGLLEKGENLALPSEARGSLALSGIMESIVLPGSDFLVAGQSGSVGPPQSDPSAPGLSKGEPPTPLSSSALLADPALQQIADLRSGDRDRVGRHLRVSPLKPHLVPHVIPLLAWDAVSGEAIQALRAVVDQHAGQLADALLEPSTDFTIRRRLPRVLSAASSHRAAEGLMLGLNDRRFEVRFQCGRCLVAFKQRRPQMRISEKKIIEAIRREVAVSRPVWEGHRLLDRAEETDAVPLIDEFLRTRTSRSLQHVFTLLSLVLPAEPLKIAFHGLHTDDPHLRGTALEYLESILPADIRRRLWPLLEKPPEPAKKDIRSKDEILADLLSSSQSIQINLEELRRRVREEPVSSSSSGEES